MLHLRACCRSVCVSLSLVRPVSRRGFRGIIPVPVYSSKTLLDFITSPRRACLPACLPAEMSRRRQRVTTGNTNLPQLHRGSNRPQTKNATAFPKHSGRSKVVGGIGTVATTTTNPMFQKPRANHRRDNLASEGRRGSDRNATRSSLRSTTRSILQSKPSRSVFPPRFPPKTTVQRVPKYPPLENIHGKLLGSTVVVCSLKFSCLLSGGKGLAYLDGWNRIEFTFGDTLSPPLSISHRFKPIQHTSLIDQSDSYIFIHDFVLILESILNMYE